MNIQTRRQFNQMLDRMRNCSIVAVDTETNGLKTYRGTYLISLSLWFPEYDEGYNVPFRHGEGTVITKYNKSNPAGTPFSQMSWTGKTKKSLYLDYWFNQIKPTIDFGNLPIEWLDDLKAVWHLPETQVYHNARFDLHVLNAEGFPTPAKVEDTMIGLHIQFGDWNRAKSFHAPYKYSKRHIDKAICSLDMKGQWAIDLDGEYMVEIQYGNRQLKWQAGLLYWDGYDEFSDFARGEEMLYEAKATFEQQLIAYIKDHPDDPYNRGIRKYDSKIHISEKAEMWMLPSYDVATYAILDTKLTWELRETILESLAEWGTTDLYYEQNGVLLRVAWDMEVMGLNLDLDVVAEQVAMYEHRIVTIDECLNTWLWDNGFNTYTSRTEVEINSPKQLLELFNDTYNKDGYRPLEVAARYDDYPGWWDTGKTKLEVYDTSPVLCEIDEESEYKDWRLEETNRATITPYDGHILVQLIIVYRKYTKALNTYLKRWRDNADSNGVVRSRMNLDGTNAGRFSSSGDGGNYQNIPDRGGYRIKECIVSRATDRILFAIDYGQLEARLAAWHAETLMVEWGVHNHKPTMTQLFQEGADLHSYTRDMVGVRDVLYPNMSDVDIAISLGYNLAELKDPVDVVVAKWCRHVGKTMNFGLLYGGGKRMLSKLLKISEDAATLLVTKWRKLFPAFQIAGRYYQEQGSRYRRLPNAERSGLYVTQQLSGRIHRTDLYHQKQMVKDDYGKWVAFNPREVAQRTLWNNVVQGLGGWMTPRALLNYYDAEGGHQGIHPFAIIHDAIDGEVEITKLGQIKKLMAHMVDFPITPHLTVDLEAGINWQDMTEVENIDLWIASGGCDGYKERD